MRLHSGAEMSEGPGLCCRQSRLRGVAGGLFACAFIIGTVFLWHRSGFPKFVWVGGAVMMALVVPNFIRTVIARFRSTNWLLQVDSDGLWINLRSLQRNSAAAAATVVHLRYGEIACVHRHIDTWSTPSNRAGSVQWKKESLDLHLASVDTRGLLPALAEARAADWNAPVSVILPAPDVIRIAWRGHGHDVAPGLRRVLAELGQRVAVADTTRTVRPDWRQLSDDELNEQIEQLVRWGDTLEASDLLIKRRGCSATEAHKIVEDLSTRR
jgi:hypothetical protein